MISFQATTDLSKSAEITYANMRSYYQHYSVDWQQGNIVQQISELDNWDILFDGEVVGGNIVEQTHVAIKNLLAILDEAGYGTEHIVRIGVWLDDPRDFWSFNGVYKSYFGEHPPARACVQSALMVDCKVEVDCVAFEPNRKSRG